MKKKMIHLLLKILCTPVQALGGGICGACVGAAGGVVCGVGVGLLLGFLSGMFAMCASNNVPLGGLVFLGFTLGGFLATVFASAVTGAALGLSAALGETLVDIIFKIEDLKNDFKNKCPIKNTDTNHASRTGDTSNHNNTRLVSTTTVMRTICDQPERHQMSTSAHRNTAKTRYRGTNSPSVSVSLDPSNVNHLSFVCLSRAETASGVYLRI